MNKSSSFCQKRDLVFEPKCKAVLCGQQVHEGHTFCSVHEYADDLYTIVRLLNFPVCEINAHITVGAGKALWYEYIQFLPDPHYRVGYAVPRVMQVYLALVTYIEEHPTPEVTAPLSSFYQKYVFQQRHLQVVKKVVPPPIDLFKVPF